jgi:hypothetical protein
VTDLTAAQWNERYPIGTPVVAYPGLRPEDDPKGERLITRTSSKAWVLGGHTAVVFVDGHGACINLTHVDPERYAIGRNGVFATLYDRVEQRIVLDNTTEDHCRRVRDQLIADAA